MLNLQNFETFKGFVPAITHVYTYVCVFVLSTCVHLFVHHGAPVCVSMCRLYVRVCVYTYHNHMYNLVFLFCHQTIHSVHKSSHPLHCAGFAVIGKDIVLKDNSVELSLAIRSMLQGSLHYVIAALKTLQAMVSESCDLLVDIR